MTAATSAPAAAPERAAVPVHLIPTSKGKYRYSLGNGSEDEYERGVYRTAKVPGSDDEWYWYPVAPLPHVTERLIRRTGDGAIRRTDYRVSMAPDDAGLIVTDEEVTRGEWANRLDIALPADMDIMRAAATAIRQVARQAGTPARETRTEWREGQLVLPPLDLLPAGYATEPADDADAQQALTEACHLAVRHPKVALMLGATLSGIYAGALGRHSYWLLATGESSQGKTTALVASAALLGDPGDPQGDPRLIKPWDFSQIGLTQWLGSVGSLPVCLDEMSNNTRWSQRDWEQAAFRSAQGSQRTVGGKEGDHRAGLGWRGVLLTTGNRSIVAHAINEAIAGRIVEMSTPIIEPADDPDAKADAKHLQYNLAERYRGWVLRRVLADPQIERIRGYIEEAARIADGFNGIGGRLADHLAGAAAGARMLGDMTGVGELYWAALDAAETVLGTSLEELEERGGNPGERLLMAVEQAVAARPQAYPTRLNYEQGSTGIEGGRLPREVEGLTLDETNSHTEIAVFTNTLPSIAANAGIEDYTTGLQRLRQDGLLVTTRKLRKRVRLSGNRFTYTYAFKLISDDSPSSSGGTETVPPPVPPGGGTDFRPVTCDVPPVPPVPPSCETTRASASPAAGSESASSETWRALAMLVEDLGAEVIEETSVSPSDAEDDHPGETGIDDPPDDSPDDPGACKASESAETAATGPTGGETPESAPGNVSAALSDSQALALGCDADAIHDGAGGTAEPEQTYASLPAFLEYVTGRMPDGGTVALSAAVAARLGYPDQQPKRKATRRVGKAQAAQSECRAVVEGHAAGWECNATGVSAWTTWHTHDERPSVCVVVLDWTDPRHTGASGAPYVTPADDPATAARLLHRYRETTGVAYTMTAGTSGVNMIRSHVQARRGKAPLLKWDGTDTPAMRGHERALVWHRTPTPDEAAHGYVHGYDGVMFYLGAQIVSEFALSALQHTGCSEFNPQRSGYWCIPAGDYRPRGDTACLAPGLGLAGDGHRWVATNTVKFLLEQEWLRPEAVTDAFLPPEGEPSVRLLHGTRKPGVGEILRDALVGIPKDTDSSCEKRVRSALKATYRETYGMLHRGTPFVKRPDWHDTILATAKANLMRKVLTTHRESGQWPIAIDTDCIYYTSGDPDPHGAAPTGLPVLDPDEPERLGWLSAKKSMTLAQYLESKE